MALFSSSSNEKMVDRGNVFGDDASKILDDLSSLRDRMAKLSRAKSSDLTGKVADFGNVLADRAGDLKGGASQYAKTVDRHVRRQPYPYLLGAMAAGAIAGMIVPILMRGKR